MQKYNGHASALRRYNWIIAWAPLSHSNPNQDSRCARRRRQWSVSVFLFLCQLCFCPRAPQTSREMKSLLRIFWTVSPILRSLMFGPAPPKSAALRLSRQKPWISAPPEVDFQRLLKRCGPWFETAFGLLTMRLRVFNGLALMVSLSNHGPHRFSGSC